MGKERRDAWCKGRWVSDAVTAGVLSVSGVLLMAAAGWGAEGSPAAERQRTFKLRYGAEVTGLAPGAQLRVWFPVPQTTAHQQVTELGRQLPAPGAVGKDRKYGNKMVYFSLAVPTSGRVAFSTHYRVRRHEVRGLLQAGAKVKLSAQQKEVFLAANRRVPVQGEEVEALAEGLVGGSDAVAMARLLYDRVDEHVRYDKSEPGYGNGDVLWVCDSRYGNCTDFHSLFISLARHRGVPARFEIGFPLPEKRGRGAIGGYHCWALFHSKTRGWVPVDISEADKHPEKKDYYFGNLTEDRVSFTTGRDIVLVPRQAGPALNYFVYPHVEADGRPVGKERIALRFSFADELAGKTR
ncbi:MAG TPA: transglutaminase [Planctomycetaceae bacterium]|nr:transglutaminase [Planctomycetaceae bacterium]|tara:strand:- start:3968 stop:5023 length:1056 start_codon:yes stop_codon:yes gene_type:complete